MRCFKHNTVSHWTDKLHCKCTGQISCLVLIYVHFLYSTLNHTWNTCKKFSSVYFVERNAGKLISLFNKQAAWLIVIAFQLAYQGFGQLWEIWKVMEFPDIILIWFEVWESHRNWVNMKIFHFSQKKKKKWCLKIHIQACSILRRGLVDYSCQPKKGMVAELHGLTFYTKTFTLSTLRTRRVWLKIRNFWNWW